MKKIDLGQTIQMVAIVGVGAGVVFLGTWFRPIVPFRVQVGIALISVLVGGVVFYRLRRRSVLPRLLISLLASGAVLLGIALVLILAFLAAWNEPFGF